MIKEFKIGDLLKIKVLKTLRFCKSKHTKENTKILLRSGKTMDDVYSWYEPGNYVWMIIELNDDNHYQFYDIENNLFMYVKIPVFYTGISIELL